MNGECIDCCARLDHASVRSRLASLGPAASSVIVSAAVLGRQFDFALLPRAARRDGSDGPRRTPAGPSSTAGRARARRLRRRDVPIPAQPDPRRDPCRPDAARDRVPGCGLRHRHRRRHTQACRANWCELAAELYVLASQPLAAARLLVTSGRRDLLKGAVEQRPDSAAQRPEASGRQRLRRAHARHRGRRGDARGVRASGDSKQIAPLADDLIARLGRAGADRAGRRSSG